MMKTKLNVITRLFLLCAMIVGGTNGAWADTVLFSTNFSTADGWITEDIITSSTTSATRIIKGTEISFKGYKSSNVTVTAGATSGTLKFTGSNVSASAGSVTPSNPNYYMAIPVTGIVGGVVSINYTSSSNFSLYYTYDDGNAGSVVAVKSGAYGQTKIVITGLTSDKATIYLGANGYTITSVSITTPELKSLSGNHFYPFYKESNSAVTAATLISDADLPSYIGISKVFYNANSSNNTSSVGDLTITSNKYYYLNPSSNNSIFIGGLSHVKSIRLYGHSGTYSGNISVTVTKVSGTGSAMTVASIPFNKVTTVSEFSTGNLTSLTGYDIDTYYYFTITFSASFNLWGLYIESSSSCTSVDAPTGLSCTDQSKSSLTFSWTAASNASSYDVTLYSDSGCSSQVATANVTSTSKEFTGLNGGTTYYCKVQSKGDGSTYCEDGNVTDAESGTTLSKDYTVTVDSNEEEYGTVSALANSLDEGEMTTITAEAKSGYKFRNWSVSDGDKGAELSSTTTNPTTLTMGSADVTVTANFSALEHYTITYNYGTYGSGDAIANGDKTEDVTFTLSSSTYTYADHIQTGWATSDGGDKVYELGGTYTGNAHLNLYPSWREQYTITYDANGGSGSMSDTEDYGDITLTANAYTNSGYTFIGWATSKANADAGTVAYADGAAYNLTANATLYAVWAANDYSFAPTETSGSILSGSTVASSTGGTLTYTPADGGSPALNYKTDGLEFTSGNECAVTVTLDKMMVPGTVISATIFTVGSGTRGLNLTNSNGVQKAAFTRSEGGEFTKQYTVVAGDGLAGSNVFKLKRNAVSYLRNLTVAKCITPYAVTHTLTNVSTVSGATGSIAAGENSEYTAVFSPNSGYALPDDITVTIGGETATENTDYTWNPITGTATVNASSVTGAIVITVVGETAPTSGTLFSLDMGTVSSTYSLSSKEELDLADYATIEGGEATLINKGAVAGYAQLTTDGGGAVQLAGTDGYIKIHLRYPLQQGDVITFTNPTNSFLISFTKTNTRSDTEKTDAGVYTCSAAMSDATTLYVWKGSMSIYNISYIRSLSIIRGVVAIKATHESGYRTFACDKALDWSGVHDGITAYTAAVDGEGKVTFTEFTGKAPATEGLLIKCEESNKNYLIPVCSSTPSAIENAMVGNVSSSTTGPGAFVLYDGEQGVGFYKTTAASFTLNANTAYFPAGVSSRSFIGLINDDEMATTVQSVAKSQAAEGQYYNLNGQKVLSPTKGLYIVDGKKIVIK